MNRYIILSMLIFLGACEKKSVSLSEARRTSFLNYLNQMQLKAPAPSASPAPSNDSSPSTGGEAPVAANCWAATYEGSWNSHWAPKYSAKTDDVLFIAGLLQKGCQIGSQSKYSVYVFALDSSGKPKPTFGARKGIISIPNQLSGTDILFRTPQNHISFSLVAVSAVKKGIYKNSLAVITQEVEVINNMDVLHHYINIVSPTGVVKTTEIQTPSIGDATYDLGSVGAPPTFLPDEWYITEVRPSVDGSKFHVLGQFDHRPILTISRFSTVTSMSLPFVNGKNHFAHVIPLLHEGDKVTCEAQELSSGNKLLCLLKPYNSFSYKASVFRLNEDPSQFSIDYSFGALSILPANQDGGACASSGKSGCQSLPPGFSYSQMIAEWKLTHKGYIELSDTQHDINVSSDGSFVIASMDTSQRILQRIGAYWYYFGNSHLKVGRFQENGQNTGLTSIPLNPYASNPRLDKFSDGSLLVGVDYSTDLTSSWLPFSFEKMTQNDPNLQFSTYEAIAIKLTSNGQVDVAFGSGGKLLHKKGNQAMMLLTDKILLMGYPDQIVEGYIPLNESGEETTWGGAGLLAFHAYDSSGNRTAAFHGGRDQLVIDVTHFFWPNARFIEKAGYPDSITYLDLTGFGAPL